MNLRRKLRFVVVRHLSRDEVVAEIKEKGLTSVKEVMNVLDWKNEEGCSKCRPAINYYLGMIHIEESS